MTSLTWTRPAAAASALLLLSVVLLLACAPASAQVTIGNPTTDEHDTGRETTIHVKTQFWKPELLGAALDPAVTITLSSNVFDHNPSTYTVSWSGVKTPHAKDVIGLWSPGELNASAAAPLMWYSANTSAYLSTGAGNTTFTTYNLRQNYIFRLVSGDSIFPNPTVIAESELVINLIPNMPSQVHLALADDSASIIVQFVSNVSRPIPVRYGTASSRYTHTAYSSSTTYTREMMCGGPAQSTAYTHPGWTHTATMSARAIGYNTKIYYMVGDNTTLLSREFSFTSPPKPGSSDPLKFLIFNDVGSEAHTLFNDTCICSNYSAGVLPPATAGTCVNNTDGSRTCCAGYCPIPDGTPAGQNWYLAMLNYCPNSLKLAPVLVQEESDAHLAILNGDLSYAQGYTDSWDVFGHQMEPAFSQWPIMTGTGNHERDWPNTGDAFSLVPGGSLDSGGECNVAYTHRYYNPGPGSVLDPRSSYYSFKMGPVFFIILDTESATDAASPQGQWVRSALDSVNRKRTPWVVVSTHRMMLMMSTDVRPVQGDNAVVKRLLHDLEDVFHGRVHFVVSGHQHAYARTCMVYNYTCTQDRSKTFFRKPDAPIYITTGNAGAGFTHSFPKAADVPGYIAYAWQDINGYVRFEADKTTLTMQAVATDPLNWAQGTKAYSFGSGAVFDSITLSLT